MQGENEVSSAHALSTNGRKRKFSVSGNKAKDDDAETSAIQTDIATKTSYSQQHHATSTIPNLDKTNDLMNRLQSFLPQIKSANQKIFEQNDHHTDKLRLDNHLEQASCSDDGDEESDSDNDEINDATLKSSTKLIQEIDDGTSKNDAERSSSKKIESSTRSHSVSNNSAGPTIQLQFAVGDMTDNPMMELLANTDDDDDNEEDSSQNDDNDDPNDQETEVIARTNTVSKLLNGSTQISQTLATTKGSLKKRLIEEIS